MKNFNKKLYKSFCLSNYLKHKNFFLIIFNDELKLKSIKKALKLNKLKISNSQNQKNLQISIKKTILPLIKNSTVFIDFYLPNLLLNNFNLLWQFILLINLNNNLYIKNFFKNLNSLNYFENKKLIYKFFILKLKKFRNNVN